jgi:hypothetical protein
MTSDWPAVDARSPQMPLFLPPGRRTPDDGGSSDAGYQAQRCGRDSAGSCGAWLHAAPGRRGNRDSEACLRWVK